MGFSIGKILILVVIIAVVWYGFKAFGRIKQKRDDDADEAVDARTSVRSDAEDMAPCPKCGAYIKAGEPHSCDASV